MSTLLSIGGLKSTVMLDATQFAAGMAHVVQLAQQTSQQVTSANAAMAGSFNAVVQAASKSAQQQNVATQATRQQAAAATQLEQLKVRVAAAETNAAGRVGIYTKAVNEATAGTKEYYQAQLKLISAQKEVTREQQNSAQAVAGGVGRGVLQGVGAGGILGGLGVAGGVAIATRSLIDLGKASTDLAVRAQTIGTAYEAATKRAGLGADDLLRKLNAAARGTVTDTDLMASSNKALALGVGQNAQQIADLLAIARQKGKDFGEGTAQAFEDITTGLGRLSPRILDNLGIILDENKVYQEYAKSIGVAEGKLSDQEKRQALVNELIRTNSDLIKKNADANLDAADKIANAQADLEKAKTTFGTALLPAELALIKDATAFLDSVTGTFPQKAATMNTDLEKQATSYEDYVRRVNEARNKLNPTGATGHETTPDQRIANALAAQQDTQDQFNQRRLADMAGNTKDDFYATQALGGAAQLTKDQLDALGASLQIVTDRGLRPYKTAVDDAKSALDAHKTSTQVAKDQVNELSDALSKAQKRYDEFGHAQLVGTKAYEDQKFAISQAKAQVELDLLSFKAPGAGLDQILKPIQAQIDATDTSLKGYKSDLDEINSFVEDQSRVVQEATDAQKQYDDAVGSASDNLTQQQSRLSALTDVYTNLGREIDDAKRKMDDLRRTPLTGEGALDDKLFAMDQAVKRQELAIDQAKMHGAGKDELKKLTDQLDKLRTAEDAARIAGDLRFDAQRRALEKQGLPNQERSYADLSGAIAQTQGTVDSLTEAQNQAKVAVDAQQKAVDDAKWSLMEASAAQRDHAAAVDEAKAELEKLKITQSDISKQYDEQKQKLADLKTQLDTTRTDALKPFQDAIDDLDRRASLVDLNKQLKLDPLARQLEQAFKPIHELTFQEAIDGLRTTGQQINDLQTKLASAQKVLASEEAATKEAQAHYDAAEKALTEQQKYFDNLKQGLDDLKSNLQGSKDIWGDLSTLIGAINQANGVGGMIGPKVPINIGATGSGAYDVNAINNIIGRSGGGMTGQGALLVSLSQKYGIPLPLALAMMQHESQFDSTGASVANNNPGNLKLTSLTESYGGMRGSAASDGGYFAKFQSVAQGVEAYFKLLSDVYGDFIKNNDIAGLIGKYAPSSSNDTAGYIKTVQDLITQYLEQIVKQAATTTGQGPLAAGEAALGIPGSQVTTPFSAAHKGIDLAGAEAGTPIHALEGGRILRSEFNAVWGNFVQVQDAVTGRIKEYYGHLQDRLVKVGDIIKAGDVIGTLGGTGSSATGVHLHLQMYDENGREMDPMAALAKLFGTGQGPTEADLQVLLTYLNGLHEVNGAMTDLGPNLPVLAGQIAGVGDAATAAAAATADASTAIVNATDEILNHATFKLKGALDDHAGYTGATGGMPGYKGAPDPFSYGAPGGRSHDDPTWGEKITEAADAATTATKQVQDVVPLWQISWANMGDATIASLDRADKFAFGATQNIQGYIDSAIDRINELIAKIMEIPGIHVNTNAAASFGTGALTGHAAGGMNLPAGWSWVGENGPEIAYVPGGTDIYSHRDAMTMTASQGGDTHFHIDARGSTMTERQYRQVVDDVLRERDRRFGERRRGL